MNSRKPEELDAQSEIQISRWLDVDSTECKELDDNRPFTKKIILMGFESNGTNDPAFMYTDSLGRIFGHDPHHPEKPHYPLHFTAPNGELIGFKICKKAAN